MEFYSIWPYFACLVLLLALASAPFFAIADTPPNPCGIRLSKLDGLRGFLAFGVFFHTQPFIINISKMANGHCRLCPFIP